VGKAGISERVLHRSGVRFDDHTMLVVSAIATFCGSVICGQEHVQC